jgi:phage N-6-adenine-methyltransferase
LPVPKAVSWNWADQYVGSSLSPFNGPNWPTITYSGNVDWSVDYMPAKPPKQKPTKSEQVVATPDNFIKAITNKFGPISVDLAATNDNKVCENHLGPGSIFTDSLQVAWHKLQGLLYLNPPFGNIKPWISKCAEEMKKGAQILLLVPASISSKWFAECGYPYASVFALTPRLTFKTHMQVFPKDLMLLYFYDFASGFKVWNWKEDVCPKQNI